LLPVCYHLLLFSVLAVLLCLLGVLLLQELSLCTLAFSLGTLAFSLCCTQALSVRRLLCRHSCASRG